MIGPIRQELLSGIRSDEQYQGLRDKLRAGTTVCSRRIGILRHWREY